MNVVAYACSSRPNALWSAAQFDNALPKNRTECDIPLVAKVDAEAALAAKDAAITALMEEKSLASGSVENEIACIVQAVNEWDDRTSPDDYPDHLLITSEELTEILMNFAAALKGDAA